MRSGRRSQANTSAMVIGQPRFRSVSALSDVRRFLACRVGRKAAGLSSVAEMAPSAMAAGSAPSGGSASSAMRRSMLPRLAVRVAGGQG